MSEGYIPHAGMAQFTCPFCGHGKFKSYPQAIPVDYKEWTFEHICARCGRMIGLTMVRDDGRTA